MGSHSTEQKLISILELSFQSFFYIKQTPHLLSSQVLKMPKDGNHKGFQRKMFLLAGSGQETSSCEGWSTGTRGAIPGTRGSTKGNSHFYMSQNQAKILVPSVAFLDLCRIWKLLLVFSGFIPQKDSVEFVPQIEHCPHKINYSERDYNQRSSLKGFQMKGTAESGIGNKKKLSENFVGKWHHSNSCLARGSSAVHTKHKDHY